MPRKHPPLSPAERQAAVQKVVAMKQDDEGLPPHQRRSMSELAKVARIDILKERA